MKARALFLPLAAVFAAFAIACGEGDVVVQSSDSSPTGISATGVGSVTAEPDVAIITLGVSVQRDTVQQAREDAATAAGAIIDSLKGNGVDEKDIQTVRFSIQPRFDFRSGDDQPRIIGYVVDNVVSARIRDIDSTGQVIDDAVTAGGNDAVVQNVAFTIDDPTELRAEARQMAVEQAKAQAEELASAAGVELGALLSISEGGGFIPFPSAGGLGGADAAIAESPIQAGELQISVSVTLFYALKQ